MRRRSGSAGRWLLQVLKSRFALFCYVVVAAVGIVAAAAWLPGRLVDLDVGVGQPNRPLLDPAELEQAIATRRLHILFAAGGVIAVITLVFTWRRDQVARRSADLDRDANFTTRYTEAIRQLGDDKLAIRLGGVYALERIAADSERDRQTVLDVLSANVRSGGPTYPADVTAPKRTVDPRVAHNEPEEEPPALDKVATAVVIGRITQMSKPLYPVDVSGANLIRAELSGADLAGANLSGTILHRANLSGAKLNDAELGDSNMFGAVLVDADLSDANLFLATLARADFTRANLTRANISSSVLTDVIFSDANLTEVNLCGLDLSLAYLDGAILDGVRHDGMTKWPSEMGSPDS